MPAKLILSLSHDPQLLSTRERLLLSAGYDVESTDSTNEAISRLGILRIDLVVIGHTVPAEDRQWFISQVREYDASVPVVFIAPFSDPSKELLADVNTVSLPAQFLSVIREALSRPRRSA